MLENENKNMDIQALRGIAILMVIYAHIKGRFPMPSFYEESFKYITVWSGVDIFLAISGFLMCMTLNRDISKSGKNISTYLNFWIRRIFRLMPALIFWVLVYVVVTSYANERWFPNPENLTPLIKSTLLGYANIYWSHGVVNRISLGPQDMSDMFAVTWSLSLEWQLYLIISLSIFTLSKNKSQIAFVFIVLASLLMPTNERQNTEYIWWFRPGAFMLGAITYYHIDKIKIINNLRLPCVIISLLIFLFIPYLFEDHYVIPVISALSALILMSAIGKPILSNGVVGRLLVWIGERSYSVYLCHYAIIHLISKFIFINTSADFYNSTSGTILMLTMFIVLTSIASDISYRVFERKLIRIVKILMLKRSETN
ncbi:acyltransferase family protein [Candidatus Pantoea soli]|uniref:Acyltransferase n=1 Tax=Candidatus Pantoea soli TaxID=3098669 RepID=A0A518XDH2_9GAMM|nr:acyltransferase [Pantoea soli]QDY42229.1 acyltransferase [Pantoea soli]